MPKITVEIRYADRAPEVREFNQAKVIIGRDSGNIVLGDHLSSARHAELNVGQYGAVLVDLGSTNGTYMASGERVQGQMPLRPGSEFRIGSCSLVLRSFESGAQFGPKGTMVMAASEPDRAERELAATAAAESPLTAPPTPHAPPPNYGGPPLQPPGQYAGQYGAPPPFPGGESGGILGE
jgi:pSer/pThr/pTyr-binding forkhead associated (FHA) protein